MPVHHLDFADVFDGVFLFFFSVYIFFFFFVNAVAAFDV